MWAKILFFISGLIAGFNLGFILMAILCISKEADGAVSRSMDEKAELPKSVPRPERIPVRSRPQQSISARR
jgi:hypothetical protein